MMIRFAQSAVRLILLLVVYSVRCERILAGRIASRTYFQCVVAAFELVCAVAVVGTAARADDADPRGIEFFEQKIRPILVQHCYECHSAKAKALKGGLRLDTREGIRQGGDSGHAVEPSDVEDSLLISALRQEDFEMPPDGKLPDEVIADFVKWIEMGAPDPRDGTAGVSEAAAIDVEEGRRFWAFQPLSGVVPPTVQHEEWIRRGNDIDRFVVSKMEARGLSAVGDADRPSLIRRATFDLIGLPPTPAEVDDFVSDGSPDAFAKVIDRLLRSPQFGERWGRHWLDVARYAESMGRTRNFPFPYAWRYRDYVIASLNRDKPYDRFVVEQIAGDLLPSDSAEQHDECLVATGFLTLGSQDLNERDEKKYGMDLVDEQINVVGRGILALTAGCARCHDHKFDPIPTRDYYALAGIFSSTEVLSGLNNRRRGGGNQGYYSDSLLVSLSGDPPIELTRAFVDQSGELQERIAQVTSRIKRLQASLRRGTARKNQQAGSAEGRPIDRNPGGDAALDDTRMRLAQARKQLKRLNAQLAQYRDGGARPANLAMAVRDRERPVDCRIHVRGDTRNLGESVPRGFLQVLADGRTDSIELAGSGRLELARWLTDPDTPAGALTARVMVNRIWHHLFGRGIVRTVDNFGQSGERPTHPQLLDYLARRFIHDGWSIKSMIRTVMLSRTYQRSSAFDARNYGVDPDNMYVWRVSQRRMEAESLRDAMLLVSGRLDVTPPVGSPVMNYPLGEVGRVNRANSLIASSRHRSVYLPVLRGFIPTMFETFDFAEPSEVKGRRDVTTVATQALFMMNSPFVMEQSRHAADGLLRTSHSSDRELVDVAYHQTFSRKPTEEEVDRALAFVRDYEKIISRANDTKQNTARDAWARLYHSFFCSAEFRYVN